MKKSKYAEEKPQRTFSCLPVDLNQYGINNKEGLAL